MTTDIRRGDRVRWQYTDQRGVVRTVSPTLIVVEWDDGRVRGYEADSELHRVYVPQRELAAV